MGPEVADAATLLDRGAALLTGMADDPTPILRWYRATTPAVVLGRGQTRLAVAAGLLDPDGCSTHHSLPVVTRVTGGGAVWMDSDLLSLDVVVPSGHPLTMGTLSDAFLPIGRAWRAALRDLGVTDLSVHEGPSPPSRHTDPTERLLADLCYARLGRGEVAAGGRKLVGLAQRRPRTGALVQCGLLRRWRPSRLLAALGREDDDEHIAKRAVGLDELLAPPPHDTAVMEAVEARLGACSLSTPGRQ